MVIGQGSTTETLNGERVQALLARALEPLPLDGKRVLIIIPDGTRTAWLGMRTFGASAPLQELQHKFGFTPEKIITTARELVRSRSHR